MIEVPLVAKPGSFVYFFGGLHGPFPFTFFLNTITIGLQLTNQFLFTWHLYNVMAISYMAISNYMAIFIYKAFIISIYMGFL